MFRSKDKEESSLEIYVLRITVGTASDLPLVESFVKVRFKLRIFVFFCVGYRA